MRDSTSAPNHSAAPTLVHMDALPTGTRLGEFEIQALLGVGGFGMVYRGYDHSLQRAVAIKEYMPAALVGRSADLQVTARSAADQQPFAAGLTSFIAEARVLARFDHPSLVKVYRFWEANQTAYMAMPLYSGVTLKQARRQMSGPPPEAWLRTVLWSILEALKVLHANGTLHRDVSPDNIFLQDIGPPVLLDLGSARHAITDGSHKHTAVLKVNYAPIEQYADALDLKEGAWTDLYALGAVVHACVCNEAPVPATFRVINDRMPPFARIAQTVQTHFGTAYSAAFCLAIDHALALRPADRTQSAEALAHEMDLRAPDAWAQFDWRQSLGPAVTLQPENLQPDTDRGASHDATHILPAQPVGDANLQPTTPQTIAGTTNYPSTPVPPNVVVQHEPVTAAQPSVQRHRWGWWLASACAALVTVAVLVKTQGTVLGGAPPAAAPITTVGAEENGAGVTNDRAAGTGKALCAHVPFYKRSWCVYQECQKPGMTKVPACVEQRKHRARIADQSKNF